MFRAKLFLAAILTISIVSACAVAAPPTDVASKISAARADLAQSWERREAYMATLRRSYSASRNVKVPEIKDTDRYRDINVPSPYGDFTVRIGVTDGLNRIITPEGAEFTTREAAPGDGQRTILNLIVHNEDVYVVAIERIGRYVPHTDSFEPVQPQLTVETDAKGNPPLYISHAKNIYYAEKVKEYYILFYGFFPPYDEEDPKVPKQLAGVRWFDPDKNQWHLSLVNPAYQSGYFYSGSETPETITVITGSGQTRALKSVFNKKTGTFSHELIASKPPSFPRAR